MFFFFYYYFPFFKNSEICKVDFFLFKVFFFPRLLTLFLFSLKSNNLGFIDPISNSVISVISIQILFRVYFICFLFSPFLCSEGRRRDFLNSRRQTDRLAKWDNAHKPCVVQIIYSVFDLQHSHFTWENWACAIWNFSVHAQFFREQCQCIHLNTLLEIKQQQ